VDVPGLHFAEMIRAGFHVGTSRAAATSGAGVSASCCVFRLNTEVRTAQIVICGDVYHAGLRAECDGRPVLAAVQVGAEVCALACTRFLGFVDFRPSGHRIEADVDILIDIRLAVDELDRALRGALEKPEISVACDVDESLYGAAVA